MVHSAEAFDEDARKYGGITSGEHGLNLAKAGLAQHQAQCELGLGQNVELNVTGKLVGIEIERVTGVMLYTVELKDSKGVFLSTARVTAEMIVR